MNTLDKFAQLLIIVGGLNWGLIGFFNFNLVAAIFGEGSLLSRIVYALVGLAAVYIIYPMVAARTDRDHMHAHA